MTLKECVQNNPWSKVSAKFLKVYPEAKKDIEKYKKLFEKLITMTPERKEMSIVISKEKDEDEVYIEVSGLHNHPKTEEEKYLQGIEFVPWCQWLGMDISNESLAYFSEEEIIVQCLYEMTFVSFEEEDIQKTLPRSN